MWVHGTWNLHFNKSLHDPLFPISSGTGDGAHLMSYVALLNFDFTEF